MPSADSLPSSDTDIAIVGLAGRFPGARTPEQLWGNVAAGVESILPLTQADLRKAGVAAAVMNDPDYVAAAAQLDGVGEFDAEFFGCSPADAAMLDPQHRHFLECAWEAMEDAGHVPGRFQGTVGVYAGCGLNSYFLFNLLTNPDLATAAGLLGPRQPDLDKDALTTRVSTLLGLTGPSLGVQTACSTSLVAVHVACQQLLGRECDLALAGGVTIELPHGVGYRYNEGEILSPDGHCRAFDADASGTVFGSGVGIAVLRRMRDAVAAGDHIYAVVKGSAINNDGYAKVGYLAPSVDGQAAVVREALGISGVPADRIGYLEAHGTGTPVGDPIEIAALTQAYRASTERSGFCAIGSLKTNIGHLDTAAGIAGLMKAVKALEHRQLPPSLHFARPNPAIDFTSTPFAVNTALRPWPAPLDGPRCAAVNSLGVGGTNAHVILEEAPPLDAGGASGSAYLLVLSARTREALDSACTNLAAHLAAHPSLHVADVAFTLQTGRRAFDHRRVVAVSGVADAVSALTDLGRTGAETKARPAAPAVVFVFPDGGATHHEVGAGLFEEEPAFRAAVTRCVDAVRAAGGPGLSALPYATADAARPASTPGPVGSALAAFIADYALVRMYESWGLIPDALLGEGVGAYLAAHEAGVMSLEDALAMTRQRGAIPEGPSASFADVMASVTLRPPSRPVVSSITGEWGGVEMATADYWVRQASAPARDAEAVRCVASGREVVFMAMGDERGSSKLVLEAARFAPVVRPIPRRDEPQSDLVAALLALGALWVAGADVRWDALHHGRPRRRVPLPTYPFARTRHWVEPGRPGASAPVELQRGRADA